MSYHLLLSDYNSFFIYAYETERESPIKNLKINLNGAGQNEGTRRPHENHNTQRRLITQVRKVTISV